jgi:hypothetical protein
MVLLAVSSSKEGPMGVLDTLKGLVGGHKDQAKDGVDKAGQTADQKTGGSYSSQINTADTKADQEIDGLDDGNSTSTT